MCLHYQLSDLLYKWRKKKKKITPMYAGVYLYTACSSVVLRCASTPVSYKKDNADNLTQTRRKDQHGKSSGRQQL